MILVIKSVVVTVLLVAFSFGLSGAIASTPAVSQLGSTYISQTSGGHYQLSVTLKSAETVRLVGVYIDNHNVTSYEKGNSTSQVTLYPGVNALTLCLVPTTTLPQGTYVDLTLSFSNGETLMVVAIYLQ